MKPKRESLADVVKLASKGNSKLARSYREMADMAEHEETRALFLELEQRVIRDNEEFHDVMCGRIKCPVCGSMDQLLIVYEPSVAGRGMVHVDRPRTESDPRWECRDCGTRWSRPYKKREDR